MICKTCGKFPSALPEFREMAEVFEITPDEYIRQHENTYDPKTDRFFCTDCWVKAGLPVRTKAGIRHLRSPKYGVA